MLAAILLVSCFPTADVEEVREAVAAARSTTDPVQVLEHVRTALAAVDAGGVDAETASALEPLVTLALGHREFTAAHEALALVLKGVEQASDTARPRERVRYGELFALHGDLRGGAQLVAEGLAGLERVLDDSDPELNRVRRSLGVTYIELEEPERARVVLEGAVPWVDPESEDALELRTNLALVQIQLGDLLSARVVLEQLAESVPKRFAPGDPQALVPRANLATVLRDMGDLNGARNILEEVIASWEKSLPPQHLNLQRMRMNLAGTLGHLREHEAALSIVEEVLTSWRARPAADPLRLGAEQDRAIFLRILDDFDAAREAEEELLATCESAFPPHHPRTQAARRNLASTLLALGETERAAGLLWEVLEFWEGLLPSEHPDVLGVRTALCDALAILGETKPLLGQLERMASDLRRLFEAGATLSRRERGSWLYARNANLASLVTHAPQGGLDDAVVFELVETLRALVSATAPDILAERSPEVAKLREALAAARREVARLVGSTDDTERLGAATRLRDEAERALQAVLVERGAGPRPVRLADVVGRLGAGEVAVGFWAYMRSGAEAVGSPEVHLLAHVVRADGSLRRVELGSLERIEQLVQRWRRAVGQPLTPARGVPLAAKEQPTSTTELDAGRALREHLLDPVFAAAGEGCKQLILSLDHALHLVPFDALPLAEEEGGVVGDRFGVRMRLSHAPPSAPLEGDGPMVVAGGVAFGAGGPFQSLPGTLTEAESIAAFAEEALESEPVLLTGQQVDRAALARLAPAARFLHLATHGFFTGEELASTADVDRAVHGLAPMTLCGLALAGANAGRDASGRPAGIVTAEELSGFDLSNAALAVLSACDTNVGVRRAGQGIHSLQAALHIAGARAALTSLWKVEDEPGLELMLAFYRGLWDGELSYEDALWQAKLALRERGAPTRAWAGWVLTR